VVRGFSFQKVPNCDWHRPRSHINRMGPIKTTDQVPAEIVQIGIEDGGNLRPSFVVAKNLAAANYSDNLAGLRIDNIALEHVFLFPVLRVRCDVYNSEFGALFRFGAIVRGCRDGALSDVLSPTLSIVCEPCSRYPYRARDTGFVGKRLGYARSGVRRTEWKGEPTVESGVSRCSASAGERA